MSISSNDGDNIPLGRTRFPVKIKCPKCKKVGSAIWEENAEIVPKGPMPLLISLSDGFYERASKSKIGLTETVCETCDIVLID